MNLFHMRMYAGEDQKEAYAVCETSTEASTLFTKEFGVSPDFVSRETYGDIKLLQEKKDE